MVLRHAVVLAGVGTLAGLGAAFAATRVLETLLFRISPRDAVTFAVVPTFLVAVALAAAYVPARRATRLDPVIALRLE
jgi:ABC-type antimicrobial peptide transport system permease subunit